MPFARATGMGSTFDCADHSNSVCFLVRSTISWPVMVGTVVTVVIRCSGLTRRLSGNLRAAWACESIRLHTTLGNAGQSSFEHIQPFIHLRRAELAGVARGGEGLCGRLGKGDGAHATPPFWRRGVNCQTGDMTE